jgi:hypothetical protein
MAVPENGNGTSLCRPSAPQQYALTRIKVPACRPVQTSALMSAAWGLPIIGVLLIVLVLVRNAARKAKLRRRQTPRGAGKFHPQSDSRSERSEMRETAHNGRVVDTLARTTARRPTKK